MEDKFFEVIVFKGSILENNNEHEVFVGLVLEPAVDRWLEMHEGVVPSA